MDGLNEDVKVPDFKVDAPQAAEDKESIVTNEMTELEALKADTKDPLAKLMIESHLKQIQNKEEAVQKVTLEATRMQTVATFVNIMLSLVYET